MDAKEKSPPDSLPWADYETWEYTQLPHFGFRHLNLPDAAFLAAIDLWRAGFAPGLTGEEWGGDHERALPRWLRRFLRR